MRERQANFMGLTLQQLDGPCRPVAHGQANRSVSLQRVALLAKPKPPTGTARFVIGQLFDSFVTRGTFVAFVLGVNPLQKFVCVAGTGAERVCHENFGVGQFTVV
jgi:hypothetical protein